MFRAIVSRPSVAIGSKGEYKKQTVGIYLMDKDGVEDDFPTPVGVVLKVTDPDYPKGEYTVSPASFGVTGDKYGNTSFSVNRLILTPRKEAARRPAAA